MPKSNVPLEEAITWVYVLPLNTKLKPMLKAVDMASSAVATRDVAVAPDNGVYVPATGVNVYVFTCALDGKQATAAKAKRLNAFRQKVPRFGVGLK